MVLCLQSVLLYRTHLCLWQCTVSNISLSLLPFFLWEVNLDSENRKKGPPCDSKTRLLILDSYTHTRPCPYFLRSVQRTPLNPSPQGNRVRGRAGQSRSSPVRVLQFSEAQDANWTRPIINTRTRGKCFCFTFTFSLSLIWKAQIKEGSWASTDSEMVNEEHFHRFRSLTWFVVDLYGEKAALYLTFLLHACFTREQQSAAMEWSAVHSWDDCRDKQGGSFINMKLIMCHSLHLCRLSFYSHTNGCRRTTSVGIFTHRTTAAQPRPFHSYSHTTTDWRFV